MTDLTAVIEESLIRRTLPNSKNGTVRGVASAVLESIDGNGSQYRAIKETLTAEYDREGTLSPSDIADFARRAAAAIEEALESVEEPVDRTEVVRVPVEQEEATVENLTATLAELGRLAESAPEALNDAISTALQRFGISS